VATFSCLLFRPGAFQFDQSPSGKGFFGRLGGSSHISSVRGASNDARQLVPPSRPLRPFALSFAGFFLPSGLEGIFHGRPPPLKNIRPLDELIVGLTFPPLPFPCPPRRSPPKHNRSVDRTEGCAQFPPPSPDFLLASFHAHPLRPILGGISRKEGLVAHLSHHLPHRERFASVLPPPRLPMGRGFRSLVMFSLLSLFHNCWFVGE